MYLVSLYFDEKSSMRITSYMKRIAKRTGEDFMIRGEVPAHLTVLAFDAKKEDACYVFESLKERFTRGSIYFATVGAFLPHVLYISPVLNEYLFQLQKEMYESLLDIKEKSSEINIRNMYKPYSWIPHATLAKKLSKEQMATAFALLQEEFGPFEAEVVRIGLARTNPYDEIVYISL